MVCYGELLSPLVRLSTGFWSFSLRNRIRIPVEHCPSLGWRAYSVRKVCDETEAATAHYASPFATTCGTVVQIAQAPAFQIQDALGRQPVKQVPPKQGGSPPLSSAAVLVSEDMAIRVFSAKSRALLSTLPPPPNAKVQVLEVFLCPEWQLLILWLSSEEVAIFYVPSAPLEKSKAEEQPIPRTQAATPLLLRRFSIVEVRTQMMDKDLSKESFRCVSLYHGPLPKGDTLLHTVKVAQQVLEEDSSPASPRRQIPKQTPPTGFHPLRSIGSRWLCRARAFLCSILGRRRRQCFRHGDKDGKELTLIAGASPVLQRPSVAVQRRASLHGAAAGLRATARRAARRRRTNHWVRGSSAGGKRSLAGGSLVNAKMDSKSLRKMGLMCLLSYGFVSNVNALLLILLATYRSIVATGASPLASPVALKQFGITWAGLYVISNIVRPVRISIALAISKPFDNMEKLSCKRWMAVGLVVLLLNVVLTIAFLWGGMLFVSSITGVKVDPSQRDWYLLVGTQMGTLQAFKIADLLMQLPVWGRLAPHLPKKEHTRRSPARAKTMRASVLKGAVKEADGRLAEIEKEHEAAMEASRTPGQRPFPPSGPQLKLYSRWRRHDYAIDFVKSMADLILTIDAKNGLKVCQAEDSRILFRLLLPEFSCLTPYIVLVEPAPEDHRSAEGDAQAQVESDAEVPPPTPQLLGVTLGNSRGSLEMVELPWTSPDVEVFSSQASHGGPVLQVDYLLPIEIFVSVGEDDTVRFWSSALQLLREVFFPQPCSTVAFLRLPDMDTSAGHGDVLVGFAAHVERVPMEVWARGVKHEKLGGTLPLDSTMRSSQGSKATGSSAFTKSSTQEMDELLLQELYRFSPEDEDVLGGERPPSSEIVKLVDEELPKRRRSRTVMDFRGAPVVPLGVLGGLAADMRLSHRPEALEHVPHEHSQVLDQGDLRAITRYHAGYYDWTVNPSAMVDAPRGCAIRGVTGDGNVAIVTSVGIGHLRGEGHAFQPAPQEAPSEELFAQTSREEEPEAGELLDEAPLALPGPSSPRPQTGASVATSVAATSRRPDSREPRLESRTSARTGEAQARGALEECIEETDDEGMVKDEEEEEDTWRNLHIARGVPHRTDMPKPQTQNIANTDADAAKMLREHGKLIDAPEGLETNFLSRLTNKKTEWIYCGIDNEQVARRTARKVVRQTIDEGEGLKLWTATGRLRTGHRPPPQQALPKCYVPLPPEHLWERPPMTRSEVTERRIIEAARCPQSRNWMEELALESAEFHEARGPLITSARVRARGAQSSRSASSVTVTSAAETDTSSSVGRPGRPRLPRKVSFNLPQVPKTHR
eukprot:s3476_g8.t6